jgi:hypothetical protein
MSDRTDTELGLRPSPISDAIYTQDIIESVFLLFDGTKWEERGDLYNLALVCKNFKGPALNRIWEFMTSCIPLLDLLPNLEEVDDKIVGSPTIAPVRPSDPPNSVFPWDFVAIDVLRIRKAHQEPQTCLC